MMMLVFVEGVQKGQRYPVTTERLTLGRDRQNDIPIDDPLSSRIHVRLQRDGAGLALEDMGSTNGTFVNGTRVDKAFLRHGDRIMIGDTILMVQARSTIAQEPMVTISEETHDTSVDMALHIDSTAFLSKDLASSQYERHQQQLQALFDFISETTTTIELDYLLELSLQKMAGALKADCGAVLFQDAVGGLHPKAVWPKEKKKTLTISRSMCELVTEKRRGVLSQPGLDSTAQSQSLSGTDVGSILCVPLIAADQLYGVVYLYTNLMSTPFTEDDLKLLTAMGTHLGTMVQNAQMVRSLLNAEEFSACILKSLPSGVLVINDRDMVIRANDAAMQILGVEQKDLVGLPLAGVARLRQFAALIAETSKSGIPVERSELIVQLGEREVPLGVNTAVLEDYAAHPIGVVCTFQDLTRLKKMADEVKRSQRLASLGEMATGIAHEVRNPLNSVRGFAQLLMEGAKKREDDEEIEYANIVISEVDRINKIVQDMLDFSRQQSLTMRPVDLASLVEQTVRQFAPQSSQMGVDLTLEGDGKPLPCSANADKLKQLFLNMISNAAQACAKNGSVTVKMGLENTGARVYPEACITIEDNGVGISRENLDRIFNPFFTTKDIGTGLGLPICQKIIEQHAGRIEVDSTPGVGSTFRIYLPLKETAETKS